MPRSEVDAAGTLVEEVPDDGTGTLFRRAYDSVMTDPDYAMRLGNELRATRERKGLSLPEVEERSTGAFKASVLDRWEKGQRDPSWPRLQELARFYGVAPAQLVPEARE